MNSYIVATTKPWNIDAYHRYSKNLSGTWYLVTNTEQLQEMLSRVDPEYIFFPHWSWIVPQEITDKYNCVCFHMTDVPYGRGGSPLQNLIERGHKSTKLSAIKMVTELDAGPVYCRKNMSLLGSAQDIYTDMAEKVYEMISQIIDHDPIPLEQKGEVVRFERRTPDQSVLPETGTLSALYDHIRMLDAETYPVAFINHGDFNLEFTDVQFNEHELQCRVSIKKNT